MPGALLRKATPERLSVFSDGVFAVLITVLVPGAITTNMGQIAAATQSATEATSRVRQASQELAA